VILHVCLRQSRLLSIFERVEVQLQFTGDRKTAASIAVAIICAILWSLLVDRESPSDLVRKAYSTGNYADVVLLATRFETTGELDGDSWWYTVLACQALREKTDAVKYFHIAVDSASESSIAVDTTLRLATMLDEQGVLTEAADVVVTLIGQRPNSLELRRTAIKLLDTAGFRYRANLHRLVLLKSGHHSLDDLIFLANRSEAFVAPRVERAIRDPLSTEFRVTRALIAWQSGKLAEAAKIVRAEIASSPETLDAHALLGRVLLDQGKMESLAEWHQELPGSADEHPDVWFVRGSWAEHLDRPVVALNCYLQAVKLDPDFQEPIYRLSVVVSESISSDVRNQLKQRAELLERYKRVCRSIFFKGPQRQFVAEAIDLAESLKRFHEAVGWLKVGKSGIGSAMVDRERLRKLQSKIATSASFSDRRRWKLMDEFPVSDSAIPAWPQPKPSSSQTKGVVLPVRFSKDSLERGLICKYENGADGRSGLMIRQSMGGGVAVIDFDCDSWPDIFIPQGQSPDVSTADGLFRNLSGEFFSRVDRKASCGRDDYSHGAAVGDVNDDGFPDLYVANSGINRLYLNNGDGTFSTVDHQFTNERWTVSCAIADLNDDTFPDLFDVNYLEWDRPFNEICNDSELGLPRTCPPDRFQGERNDLQLNSGNGSFRNATHEAGLGDLLGKSLGVIAADFSGTGRIGLFVANDEVPNSYLQNKSQGSGGQLQFVNQANAAGLALDGTGESLACMGIASSDINHDGHLDLFVTNFYRQSNTLYLSTGPDSFEDATRSSGLSEPGLLKLGFGTQFLDANLDGKPDLVVGNGHLDDFTQKGIPFAMRPQLFLNQGSGRFAESSDKAAGTYFEGKHIARGIATLDWNRDGLTDFAVSHIGEPVELLTNDTFKHGHFVTIRLIGVDSGRDSIGATVTVTNESASYWQQVTAGDGYASANQRMLTFGLGHEAVVDSATIKWPSGRTQEFRSLSTDRNYVVIESADELFEMPD